MDKRGSNAQRYLFEIVLELYSNYTVEYEKHIGPLNQRFDIFVNELGLAIEYDGEQHYKYNSFFHGNMNNYIEQLTLDEKKEDFAEENGIKVVRFCGDVSNMTASDVREVIDSIPYPQSEYSPECLEVEHVLSDFEIRQKEMKKKQNEKAREYRKLQYRKMKERMKGDK